MNVKSNLFYVLFSAKILLDCMIFFSCESMKFSWLWSSWSIGNPKAGQQYSYNVSKYKKIPFIYIKICGVSTSVRLSICLSILKSVEFQLLSVCLFVCKFVHPNFCLSICKGTGDSWFSEFIIRRQYIHYIKNLHYLVNFYLVISVLTHRKIFIKSRIFTIWSFTKSRITCI